MMDVSIVIVNYNVRDYLQQCLTSIQKAKGNLCVEVIVVDNNSADNSIAFLTPLFPEVEFISSSTNLGFAKANNIGLKKCSGKYLLFLNPDTLLSEDTLTKMYEFMETQSEVGIAGCKVLNADGSFQVQCRRGFPTPWTSFCKLFGLSKLFPKSPLFAKYNQTFRSEDATYPIDAVIGAFMFCDTALIRQIGGFDERYFMYGEDIDLCRQVQLNGRLVYYFHKTNIIHFKGESTRRSSINDLKYQYESMRLFSEKYFANSTLFLLFLRMGIFLRSLLARVEKYSLPIILIFFDLLFINFSLMVGSYAKFGEFFGFPLYAYPLVFIVISVLFFMAQFLNGEYFENRVSIPSTCLSLMISFFILSSLTYFFPAYRFSRGALIVTIGLTTILTSVFRFIVILYRRSKSTNKMRRVIIAGKDEKIDSMKQAILSSDNHSIQIIGVVATSEMYQSKEKVLGYIDNIKIIATQNQANEVIITDTSLSSAKIMKLLSDNSKTLTFHIVPQYDELITERIIEEVANDKTKQYNLNKLRFRFIKRSTDILFAVLCLTIGLPFCIKRAKKIWSVLAGSKTFVGIYPTKQHNELSFAKEGLLSLAKLNNTLNNTSVEKLNEYYLRNYEISLDIEIIIKKIIKWKV